MSALLTEAQLDWAVITACHSFMHAEERWVKRRESGVTDAELLVDLNQELGLGGGVYMKGQPKVEWNGGKCPYVVVVADYGQPEYMIDGQDLLSRVRRVLNIGYPAPAGQLVMQL